MELRGYGYRKELTWQRSISLKPLDRALLASFAVAVVAYLVVRVTHPGFFV
jgi:energy-coupling factor transporter transmembrane protein EcfT